MARKGARIERLTESLLSFNEEVRLLRQQLTDQNALLKEIASLKEQLKLERKHRFGSKSQKGRGKADASKSVSYEEDKDNFDGTGASLASSEAGHTINSIDMTI